MGPEDFTLAANQASARYQRVLETYQALLVANRTKPFSSALINALRGGLKSVAEAFLKTERERIESELLKTALDAVRDARSAFSLSGAVNLPANLEAFLAQSSDFLENELRGQLDRDAAAVIQRLREFAVGVQMHARATGAGQANYNSRHALDPRFRFRDRIGRSYQSEVFVRSVWRHTQLLISAEFYLLEAAALGASKFTLAHVDQSAPWNGVGINMDANSELSFQSIREEVFHPNSNYTLKVADVHSK